MSAPITAVGPLKVLMKPILTVLSWAIAGPEASASAVPATIHGFCHCIDPLSLAHRPVLWAHFPSRLVS